VFNLKLTLFVAMRRSKIKRAAPLHQAALAAFADAIIEF
jgi:hypothetical protein